MIVKDGLEVYPLRRTRVCLGEQVIWELSGRGKSWFILDLALAGGAFVPVGAAGFVTADGQRLTEPSRREGAR